MTPAERGQIREQITKDLLTLDRELLSLEKQLQPISPECGLGELLRSEMMYNQEVLNRAFIEAKKRYNNLIYAQSHLEDDSYGLCVECDEEIAIQRLIVMPEAQQCIDCANERDG